MTQYMIKGSNIFIGNELDMQVANTLPVGTYAVTFNPMQGFYLTKIPDFDNPKKLYGNTDAMADRFLNTFAQRRGTTGVLLCGLKGSGKSLVMKVASAKALAKGMPTLVVSQPFAGDQFNQFIQSISDECIIVFDEFEKIYDDEGQEKLLTLLDGVFTTKKLVFMTANNRGKINSHMINRPGRLFYNLNYKGLSRDFIIEYCKDKLDSAQHDKIEQICTFAALAGDFNFDMLQAMVEELNRYGESVKEVLTILNVKVDSYAMASNYDILVTANGENLKSNQHYPVVMRNPLAQEEFWITRYFKDDDEKDEDEFLLKMADAKITPDLKKIDIVQEYNGTKYEITFLKKEEKEYNYYGMLE